MRKVKETSMTDVITDSGKTAYRAGAIIAVATCLLLSWMNAAVGIAGNEENPVNLAFFALVAMVGVGAFVSEGRSRGLARALFCAAAFQMVLGAIVSTGPVSNGEPHGSWGMIALNGFYALLWIASGALFAKAARTGHR
jgi:peptidoglycan/LPS O-acetylase OafA/YrhL